MPLVQSGKVKALGLTGTKRSELLPDVPTLAEQGVGNFETSITNYYMLLGPRGIPRPIVALLHQEIVRMAKAKDFRQKLAALGAEALASTPEECAASIRREIAMWTELAKATGIRVE
jgi:tripartite-type tricarboxylate transporter receptor subunit TctC